LSVTPLGERDTRLFVSPLKLSEEKPKCTKSLMFIVQTP